MLKVKNLIYIGLKYCFKYLNGNTDYIYFLNK